MINNTIRRGVSAMLLGSATAVGLVHAGTSDVACNSSFGPDIVIGSLDGIQGYGCVDGICGYSVATNIVNIGDELLPWLPFSNQHPVIAQHMYKMNSIRIEQIGISWVKHGFGALALDDFDCDCQNPNDYDYLGIGCSDPYTTGLNGDQAGFFGMAGLGPRWEVNASTGDFPFPYATQGQGGDAIFKRLQVHSQDLDPLQNPSTVYFAEGHYVTPADALAGLGANSLGYRPMSVGNWVEPNGWDLSLEGETVSGLPAIYAWAAAYPDVMLETIDIANDGRMILAARATENNDGTWHYEYAWHNINSWRSGSRLSIALPTDAVVSNPGWHAPEHHSGTPWSNEPWAISIGESINFQTANADSGSPASPICWGTMGNAWFDSDHGPGMTVVGLGFYREGFPLNVTLSFMGPVPAGDCVGDVTGDGVTNVDDVLAVLGSYGEACSGCPEDIDQDGEVGVDDVLMLLSDWDCQG
ncbi:MAG: hypothetical protein MK116_11605 [Phycisphaerales bacterium]|nr:hypothetical protein [Phycisphaerales bacterium]